MKFFKFIAAVKPFPSHYTVLTKTEAPHVNFSMIKGQNPRKYLSFPTSATCMLIYLYKIPFDKANQ